LSGALFSGPRGWLAMLGLAARLLGTLIGGRALGRRLSARLGAIGARLRLSFWWFSEKRQVQAFRDYWEGAAECSRAIYVSRHPRPSPVPLHVPPDGARFAAQQIPGPYPVESHQGRTFRWSEPVAIVPFDLAPGTYHLEIDTLGLRGAATSLPVWLVWSGHRLGRESVGRQDGCLTLTLRPELFAPEGEQWLGIVIPPVRTWGTTEWRRLGLPIGSIRITPVESPPSDVA
jgi:hypothetical protein